MILATYRVLSAWDDAIFFQDADTPLRRVVLDEIYADTKHTYMGELINSNVERVWMLAREASPNVLAMALPLFRVCPFAFRSQWRVDCYSDFRKRAFVKAFLDISTLEDASEFSVLHKRQLFDACRTLFVLLARSASAHRPSPAAFPGSPFSPAHRSMLRALHDGLYPAHGASPAFSRTRTDSTSAPSNSRRGGCRRPCTCCRTNLRADITTPTPANI